MGFLCLELEACGSTQATDGLVVKLIFLNQFRHPAVFLALLSFGACTSSENPLYFQLKDAFPNQSELSTALDKQAKILTKAQQDAVLGYLASNRYPSRNRTIFLLSIKADLRAKEIASLRWAMVTDAEGELADAIHLTDVASKGRSGRVIPLNKELTAVLGALKFEAGKAYRPSPYVITSERGERTSPAVIVNKVAGW